MNYLGGKQIFGDKIAAVLQRAIDATGFDYVEPFLGGASVGYRVRAPFRLLSDVHPELIAMWRAATSGWAPPETVSESDYQVIREYGRDPALRAFVGFGCSYGGKYWGGYARNRLGRNYAATAARSVAKKAAGLRGSFIVCRSYETLTPTRAVVYCDPPYIGTTGYKGTKPFEHDPFWRWCVERTAAGCMVFVSEFEAPAWVPVEVVFERFREVQLTAQAGALQADRVLFVKPFTRA